MKYPTYKKICDKHKINPHQVIADGNIREILERDKDHDLEFHEHGRQCICSTGHHL